MICVIEYFELRDYTAQYLSYKVLDKTRYYGTTI